MSARARQPVSMWLIAGAATASVLIGGLGLYGWDADVWFWVQPYAGAGIFLYPTALAVIGLGLSLFAMLAERPRLAALLALWPLVFGTLVLASYFLSLPFRADLLFSAYTQAAARSIPPLPAPNAALGFIGAGLALILMSGDRTRRAFFIPIGVLGALVAALGFLASLGYVAGIRAGYTWGEYPQMAPQTAWTLTLIGAGIVALGWRQEAVSARLLRMLPILVGLGVATATIGLWQALITQERAHIRLTVANEADDTRSLIVAGLKTHVQSLVRSARRWEYAGRPSRAQWESDAQLVVDDNPGFRAVAWVDPGFITRWVVPLAGNERAVGANMARDEVRRRPLVAARARHEIKFTRPVDLIIGGKGFIVYVPLSVQGRFDGLILGAFDTQRVFPHLLRRGVDQNYAVSISDGGQVFYRSGSITESRWTHTLDVDVYGVRWQLQVSPQPHVLAAMRSGTPTAALIIGLFLALLVALSVWLAQVAWRRREAVEVANRVLQTEVAQRQRQNAYIQLLQDVAVAANEAITVEEAAQLALERVCALSGWVVGHLYLCEPGNPQNLRSTGNWFLAEQQSLAAFRVATEQERFAYGIGLPGRVLVRSEAVRVVDLSTQANFPRADVARAAGIRSGFAFPLSIATEVVGVMEFFGRDSTEPDPVLFEVMAHIGTQLGRVIERERARHALVASEAKFRTVTESAHDGIIASDRAGTILSWNRGACEIFGYSVGEAIGKSLTLLMPERYRAAHEAGMARARASGVDMRGRTAVLEGLRKDGTVFPLEISLASWRVGEDWFSSGIVRDITARQRDEQRLRSNEHQLAQAEALAHLGSWTWDIGANTVTWSDELYRIYGLEPGQGAVDFEFFLARVHAEDRATVRERIEHAYATHARFSFDHRIVLPNGDIRILHAEGDVEVDAQATPLRMYGTGQDITERRQQEEEIRALNADLERRVRERTADLERANRELAGEITVREQAQRAVQVRARQQMALAVLSQRALVGHDLKAFLQEAMELIARTLEIECTKVQQLLPDRTALLLVAGIGWKAGAVGRATVPADASSQAGYTLTSDTPVVVTDLRGETRFKRPQLLRDHNVISGMSVAIAGNDSPWGVVGAHTGRSREFSEDDVRFLQSVANVLAAAIERNRIETERAQLLAHEQEARAETERARQRLRFLADASKLLVASLDYEATLGHVAQLTVPFFADWCAIDMAVGRDSLQRVKVVHMDPKKEQLAADLHRRYPPNPDLPYGALHVLRTGKAEMMATIGDEVLRSAARDDEHLALLKALQFKSYICVPMMSRERVLGAMTLVTAESGRHYTDADLRLAEEVANRCAIAVDNARLFQLAQEELAERQAAEQLLATEKERLAVTLYSIGDGVITADTQGRVVLINKVAEQLSGWTQAEAFGEPVENVFHIVNERTRAVCESPVAKVLQSGSVVALANHTALIAKDGREHAIADSGAPIRNRDGDIIGVVLVFRDITEQQKMEEELTRARNLESIGVLAGGIAHDFNNILTAILGNISLARMYSPPGERVHEVLGEAEKAFWRARALTQQLLTFSKGGAPIKRTASIAELLEETVVFAMRGSKARSEFVLAADLSPVAFDAGQISQVVNNLVINATQAMPEGGVLRVTAENTLVKDTGNKERPPGRYVKLVFKDNGVGISPKHLEKVFDPYFTTKQHGSGLGLATVYSIVSKHDGFIDVKSRVGSGTTFTIHLPASSEAPAVPPTEDGDIELGGGRVLVMDDEPSIRKVVTELLKRLGFDTAFAADGAETVKLYRAALADGRGFDAVILDLTIPGGMGGKECMVALRAIDPQVKAIVSSGYSNDPILADFATHGFRGVVVKPYQIRELSETLRRAIGPDTHST